LRQAPRKQVHEARLIQDAAEYDTAQDRGEVQRHGGQGKRDVPVENIPSVTDIGLTRKQVFEGRQILDAAEYDEAQERGEVQKAGGKRGNQHVAIVPEQNNGIPGVTDLGLTRKEVYEGLSFVQRYYEDLPSGTVCQIEKPAERDVTRGGPGLSLQLVGVSPAPTPPSTAPRPR
jgi:hypothetical protein